MRLHPIKSLGYTASSVSVMLLAAVSWPKAKDSPLLLTCLLAGGALSIVGMALRWLTYEIEERRKGK